MKTVRGKGSDLNDKELMQKRAKRKLISQRRALSLIDVAKEKGAKGKDLIPFWNTYNCLGKVTSSNGKLFGRYCKNRFCTVCCAIRKAELIHKYQPVIKKWKDPYFVTLTTKAVKANQLQKRTDEMFFAFNKIKDKFRKWHTKGKSIKLAGLKSFECNFNPLNKTYNPHFHFIVPDRATAMLLKQEWKKYWGYELVSEKGQDIRPIENPTKGIIEIIKYGVKTFTDPDMIKDKKASRKNSKMIYTVALYNILCAMKKHRIFERFGFNVPKPDIEKVKETTKLIIYAEWVYSYKHTDWLSVDTEQTLTGYKPPAELETILRHYINEVLE